jgi:hypothetical protein
VFRIKQFFAKNKLMDQIDTVSVTAHAWSFGLYLAVNVVSAFFATLYLFFPSQNTLDWWVIASLAMFIVSLVS